MFFFSTFRYVKIDADTTRDPTPGRVVYIAARQVVTFDADPSGWGTNIMTLDGKAHWVWESVEVVQRKLTADLSH